MTTKDKVTLIELMRRFNEEELDCNGDCYSCFYYMESREYALDNCPFLVALDMVRCKFTDEKLWKRRTQ